MLRWKWEIMGTLITWILVLLAKEVVIYVMMTAVSDFYKILPEKDLDGFRDLMAKQIALMVAVSLLCGCSKFLNSFFAIQARDIITFDLMNMYLGCSKTFQATTEKIDNPDHRISTDVKLVADAAATVVEGALVVPFLIVYYSVLTWMDMTYVGPLSIYLFFAVSAICTRLLMKPVTRAVEMLEKIEAEYRSAHASVVANAESVIFAMAERNEMVRLCKIFGDAVRKQIILAYKGSSLEGVSKLFTYLGSLLTYFILSFQFFAGAYDDVDVYKRATIISKNSFYAMYLINALTNLISLSTAFSQFLGYKQRVDDLVEIMKKFQKNEYRMILMADPASPNDPLSLSKETLLKVSNLSFCTKTKTLFQNLSFDLCYRKNIFITGSNGRGKTSLTRLLAGVWDSCDLSRIQYFDYGPIISNRPIVMFLHQKPFLPYGSIYDQIVYQFGTMQQSRWTRKMEIMKKFRKSDKRLDFLPLANNLESDSNDFGYLSMSEDKKLYLKQWFSDIKKNFGLDSLSIDFETRYSSAEYEKMLSVGELQKIAFLRILYWRPHIAVLDESTASMDEKSKSFVIHKMKELDTTFICISHHENRLRWDDDDDSNATVLDLDNYNNEGPSLK